MASGTHDTTPWPAPAQERLVALWNAGKSATEIALALTMDFDLELSRSAVAGKISRLRRRGFALRGEARMPPRAAARPRKAPSRPAPPALPAAPSCAPEPSGIFVPDFPAEDCCRWPHGEGREAQWCAAPIEGPRTGLTQHYCTYHAHRAVQPPRPKGDRHAD